VRAERSNFSSLLANFIHSVRDSALSVQLAHNNEDKV